MPTMPTIDTFYSDYISGVDAGVLDDAPAPEQVTDTTVQDSIPTEQIQGTESQDTNQANEFPSFLDTQWVPPQDATPEWYQDNYSKLALSIGSEDFVKTITDTYAEQLLQTEKDVTEAMAMYRAHKAGDVGFLRQHFPEALLSIGVSPVLSEAEIDSQIEGTLKTEFGDNYADIFSEKDMVKPSSMSAKIFSRQQELYKQWQFENQTRQTKLESYKEQGTQNTQVPNNSPNPEYIEAQYNSDFKDMPREQFQALLEQIREAADNKWGIKDLSRLLTYDADIAKAREEGIREGKGLLMKDINTAGSSKNVIPQQELKGAGKSGWEDAGRRERERNMFMY